jgi:hypothetical protein
MKNYKPDSAGYFQCLAKIIPVDSPISRPTATREPDKSAKDVVYKQKLE